MTTLHTPAPEVDINSLPATTFYDAKTHIAYFILLDNIFIQCILFCITHTSVLITIYLLYIFVTFVTYDSKNMTLKYYIGDLHSSCMLRGVRGRFSYSILEDGSDRLSQNVGN
jgi:hypothetical protein